MLLGLSAHTADPSSKADTAFGGGTFEGLPKWFGKGLSAGSSEQLSVDESGNVTTSGTLTLSGGVMALDSVDVHAVQQSFTSATTTPCSIQNPFSATTTLVGYVAQITVGTSTAASIDVGTSTTAFATTTNLVAARSVASGALDTITWFPAGAQSAILGPSEYVNVKTAGVGLSGYTWTGTCSALFLKP